MVGRVVVIVKLLTVPPIGKAAVVKATDDGFAAKVPLLILTFIVGLAASCATTKY